MKIAVFSSKEYDQEHLLKCNQNQYQMEFFETQMNEKTAPLAAGFEVVCCFVNDVLSAEVLKILSDNHVKMIALRCAGYNNVDLNKAQQLGLLVARVPEYSPYAVAEHAVAIMLSLNRNIHRARNRIRENDYSLHGLVGFDLNQKTVGVIGTGKIGIAFANIMAGFNCHIRCFDPYPNADLCKHPKIEYCPLESLWEQSDIISLHCPLTPATKHIINEKTIGLMKPGVMLINTSRGALMDTKAAIDGLKNGRIGYLGLDVYEEEASLFFEDNSDRILHDDIFARLLTFNNVIITGHQGFFTKEALDAIAQVTLTNIKHFEAGELNHIHLVN